MKIEFIYFMVLWLNAFPVKSRVSSVFSPREILVRWKMDYAKHCRVLPGSYCKVHDEPSPFNTMAPRTHEAIALGPTGNLQGSVKFFCLNTGRVLKRRAFTVMPMPDRVVRRVNAIGLKKKQGRAFRFLNRQKEPYKWTDLVPEDDPEFQGLLEEEEAAAYPDISAEPPGVELESDENKCAAVTEDPQPDFETLAAAALENAGIDPLDCLRDARAAQEAGGHRTNPGGPTVVEADDDEIVYEITFDLPDTGLAVPDPPAGMNQQLSDTPADAHAVVMDDTSDPRDGERSRRYPLRSRRSAAGTQPYDT